MAGEEMTSCTPNPDGCGGDGGCSGATAELAFAYAVEAGLQPADRKWLVITKQWA